MVKAIPQQVDVDAQNYLNTLKISPSENDPAILIDWNDDAMRAFIAGANLEVLGSQATFINDTAFAQGRRDYAFGTCCRRNVWKYIIGTKYTFTGLQYSGCFARH
jgi:hypothetical protein